MNFLPVILNVIDTELGPIAETDPDTIEVIRQEHDLTGLKVRQSYIAEGYGYWVAMRAHSCETEEFSCIRDAIDWLTEEVEE